jgi:hypothetical protein
MDANPTVLRHACDETKSGVLLALGSCWPYGP